MRADALVRRRLLIDAATELFRTTNPAEVTLEAVAKKAGVGIATLYRNFADREELASATSDLLGHAQQAGLADPMLSGAQFMAQLIVITRPPISGVLDLDPQVTDRLVTALLLPPRDR